MKVDVKAAQTADIASVNNEILKLALMKACKHLRELVGINNFVFPHVNNSVMNDADMDGISWLIYFIDLASEELEGK